MNPLLAVFLALTLVSAGCIGGEDEIVETDIFHGEDIIPVVKVNDFSLYDSYGDQWNYSDNKGKALVIAFLFTNCIDICPVVSQNMKWMYKQLSEDDLQYVEFLTITVDPWRDDNVKLTDWKERTNLSWPHLTVLDSTADSKDMQAIQNVWINFEVGLTIEEVDTFILNETSDENSTSDNETSSNQTSNDTEARHHPAEYTVNHSTGTVMVDYLGNQRVWWGDNDWVVDLAYADVRMLIDEARVAYTE